MREKEWIYTPVSHQKIPVAIKRSPVENVRNCSASAANHLACATAEVALLPFAVNIALPLIVYHFAAPHLGETNGLMLCSVPVILWSLAEIVLFRRLDAISLLALLGIFLSLGAMAIGGSARFLLLRESLVTGMIGIVFLGSLLFPRPLVYYLARSGEAKRSPEDLTVFDAAWHEKHLVRAMYLMTCIWGLGLVSETALRCWLVWSLPVERFLAIAPFIGYGIYFSLMGWSLWYRSRLKAAARNQRVSRP